jgi:hypothetical protein
MNKKGLRVHTYAFSPVPEKEQLASLKFSPKLIHTLSDIIQSHENYLICHVQTEAYVYYVVFNKENKY